MAYTIPSDTRAQGSTGHIADHDNIADMLTLLAGGIAVYNVKNTTYGGGAAGNGSTDDTTAIQAALTACRTSTYGGIVLFPPGVYIISESLQIGSNTWMQGCGYGCTTIQAKNGFAPTQVGSYNSIVMLATYNNGSTTVTNIRVSGLTFNGNEANITSLPGYAGTDTAEASPIGLQNCDQVIVEDCSVINAIGYSLYCESITHFVIQRNYIITGQSSTWGLPSGTYGTPDQQDGIHVTGSDTAASQYGRIVDNFVNTGTLTAGDDCIALEAYGTVSDIVVANNVVMGGGGGNGITIPMSDTDAAAYNIVITGNDIATNQGSGIQVYEDGGSSGWLVSNVTITGNSIAAWNGNSGQGPNYAIGFYVKWEDIIIADNVISAPAETATAPAIYMTGGTNVAISGNRIAGMNGGAGIAAIQVGGTGTTTGFSVTGNIVTAAASATSAILIQNATNGSIIGNTLTGDLGTGSYGIELQADGTAVTGVAVTGNRVATFATGIAEVNTSGTCAHNACVGNALNGCTTTATAFTATGDTNTGNAT